MSNAPGGEREYSCGLVQRAGVTALCYRTTQSGQKLANLCLCFLISGGLGATLSVRVL